MVKTFDWLEGLADLETILRQVRQLLALVP